MQKQDLITLHLSSSQFSMLMAIVRDRGRRESQQASLIWRLRRAYRKACQAARIAPSVTLLFNSGSDFVIPSEKLLRYYEALDDVLVAVEDAGFTPYQYEYGFSSYGQPKETKPTEDELYEDDEDDEDDEGDEGDEGDEDDDFPGGWIVC